MYLVNIIELYFGNKIELLGMVSSFCQTKATGAAGKTRNLPISIKLSNKDLYTVYNRDQGTFPPLQMQLQEY